MSNYPTASPRVLLFMCDPDRNIRRPIYQFNSLSAEEGKHGEGNLSFSMDLDANDIDPAKFTGSTAKGYGISFDLELMVGLQTYPLNKYALVDHKVFFGQRPVININAVSMLQHLLSRRLLVTVDNTKLSFSQVAAGPILSSLLTGSYTALVNGFNPAYPYTTRADVAPWTVALGSFPGSNLTSLQEESAGNLFTFVISWLEKTGLGITLTESPVNTFTIAGSAVYETADKTATVVFSDGLPPVVGTGLLASPPVLLTDFRALANSFFGGGSGKQNAQTRTWIGSSSSRTKYGIHESARTIAAITSSLALTAEFQSQVDKLGEPKQTWEIDVVSSGELLLGRDFNRGVKVSFWHSSFPRFGLGSTAVQKTIVGWRLNADSAGLPHYSLTLGDPAIDYWGQLFSGGGVDGTFASGDRFSTKGGW